MSGTGSDAETLSAELLLLGYRSSCFPMAAPETGAISWYSPDPRAIIPLDAFTIPRSLRRLEREGVFEVRLNTSFGDVMRGCAARAESWISGEIIRAYTDLHHRGFAHSVESWKEGRLAGGLYGVAIGGAFFGESMFSRESGASKIALVALVRRLRERGFVLLDTQWLTPHLARFGAVEIPRKEYRRRLTQALSLQSRFADP